MALRDCEECGKEVSSLAVACPHCGAPVAKAASPQPPPKPTPNRVKVVLIALVVILGLIMLKPTNDTQPEAAGEVVEASAVAAEEAAVPAEEIAVVEPAPEAVVSAEDAEERRRGFHCLSKWDGAHDGFKRAVRGQMRNPSSFKHVETRVSPEVAGQHKILMTFRAENGFGGMNVGQALGTFTHDCNNFTIISIE